MTNNCRVFGFGANYTGDVLFRDNTVESTSESAQLVVRIPWSTTAMDFAGNEYRMSAAPTFQDRDEAETETFANWQSDGYDTDSTMTADGTTAGWPAPATGQFAAANTPIPAALDGFGSVRTPVPSSLRLGSSFLLLGL